MWEWKQKTEDTQHKGPVREQRQAQMPVQANFCERAA